ncbi:MAG TPA: RICIN domain-containing protein [Natronosporangium sp.]
MHTRLLRTRSLVALAAATLAAAGWLVAFPSTPASAAVQPGVFYELVSVHSGKLIDIEGRSTSAGARVIQWDRTGGTNQQFQFVDSGGGFYRIVARHSGMALDVFEWNPDNGAEIRQWTDLNGTNQQWSIIEHGSNRVSFINRFSGKALDLWEGSTANGARISQFDYHGSPLQQWELVPVDGSQPPQQGDCGSGTFNAEVTQSGSTYTARNGGNTVYTGSSYVDAIRAAVNSLTPGRTSQQRVVVRASGSTGTSVISLPSHTSFEVCGTMNVGNASGRGAVEALNATNVSIPFLNMTGNPYFGFRFYGMNGLHLGQINMQLSGGLGIRFDRDAPGSTNVRMDDIFVSGAGSHAVETWNIDGLTVGTVTARNVGEAGLLIQTTTNAEIGLVDGQNVATGTGYAVFRMANRAGRVGSSYPTNIHVGEVRATGGGRGIFCVSESGGVVIDRITISQTGNNAILLENCYNVRIAAQGGTISGGGEVRIAARSEFPNSRDITLENLTISNSGLRESPCGVNIVIRNVTLVNSSRNTCV